MRKGLLTMALGAVLLFLLTPAAKAADSEVVFGACFPNRAEIEPSSFGLICSGSLRSDGWRMNFRTTEWDSWGATTAEGQGTATFPEAWLTGDLPICWKARCNFPLTTRPARAVLSAPTKCWNQTQFNRARLYIEGTKWAVDPWDTKSTAAPLFCSRRPKVSKVITRGQAGRSLNTALVRNFNRTYWFKGDPLTSYSCRKRAAYRFSCKARWAVGDLGFRAKGTVRSVPTRYSFPVVRVKLRVRRVSYYCQQMGGADCSKRFRISEEVLP